MKKNLVAILLVLLVSVAGSGQYTKNLVPEFGISLNAMNCYTDVEFRIVDPGNFKPSAGIYAGVLFKESVGLRLEATAGKVTASDTQAIKKNLRRRKLDFTSSIKEISLLAEVHPLKILGGAEYTPALSIYLLGGVGYFAFNPKTQFDGKWIYLQPLHTEGQGFSEYRRPNYKLNTICFPLGGGLQYKLSDRFVLRGEAVYRKLKTDYLDDVSTGYIRPSLFYKYLSPTDAALAEALADRAKNPGGEPTKPGTLRGSNITSKDAYYTINLKLGIRLSEVGSRSQINYRRVRKAPGCYKF